MLYLNMHSIPTDKSFGVQEMLYSPTEIDQTTSNHSWQSETWIFIVPAHNLRWNTCEPLETVGEGVKLCHCPWWLCSLHCTAAHCCNCTPECSYRCIVEKIFMIHIITTPKRHKLLDLISKTKLVLSITTIMM